MNTWIMIGIVTGALEETCQAACGSGGQRHMVDDVSHKRITKYLENAI